LETSKVSPHPLRFFPNLEGFNSTKHQKKTFEVLETSKVDVHPLRFFSNLEGFKYNPKTFEVLETSKVDDLKG
jgi:hypothetical protein